MNIEDQVCTFEQAKKLRELGVELKSFFVWWGNAYDLIGVHIRGRWADIVETFPAYNVAELGMMLPLRIKNENYEPMGPDFYYFATFKDLPNGWRSEYGDYWTSKNFETEAQARAEALICLIENKYLKVEELKL